MDTIAKLKEQISRTKELLEKDVKKRKLREKKRALTDEEIQNIIDQMPRIRSAYTKSSNEATESLKNIFKRILQQEKNHIVPSAIPEFIRLYTHNFYRHIVDAGEPVGVLASQALAAQLMQSTLNTFHQSGSAKNVSLGLKGYREILGASDSLMMPICDIYFTKPFTFEDVIYDKRVELVDVKIDDVSEKIDIHNISYINDENNKFNMPYYNMYYMLNNQRTINVQGSLNDFIMTNDSFLRLTLNVNKMYEHKIMPADICKALGYQRELLCIPSPVMMELKSEKKLVYENGTNVYKNVNTQYPVFYIDIFVNVPVVTSVLEKSFGDMEQYKSTGNLQISTVYYTTVLIPNLQKIMIKGIMGIKNIYPEKESVWGIVKEEIHVKDNEWLLRLNIPKMTKTGVDIEHVKKLNTYVGIENVEFSDNVDEKHKKIFLRVRTPHIPDDVKTYIKTDIKWNPGQIINYYKLKDMANYQNYSDLMKEKKRELIKQNKIKEANELVTKRPTTDFEKLLDYIYASSEGSNLLDLIYNKNIDATRTISNNINEIIQLYGVEAARSFIIEQLYNIIIQNDNNIDPRHVVLIADHMCRLGYITPITEKGLKNHPVGSLTRAGFKYPKKVFHSAALTGQKESLEPVYASMMTGRLMRLGTGLPKTSINPELEKEFAKEFKQERFQKLNAESLSNTVARLEQNINDQSEQYDIFEEQIYSVEDDNGNIIVASDIEAPSLPQILSPMATPEVLSTSTIPVPKITPSLEIPTIPEPQLNAHPEPVVSNSTKILADRLQGTDVPVIPRDDIENEHIESYNPNKDVHKENLPGAVLSEPKELDVTLSYPSFETGVESPSFISSLITKLNK